MGTKWADYALEELQERFPDLRAGRCNCRLISGTSTYSQHSWCNALDIYHKDWGYSTNPVHQAWLDQVHAFIRTYFDELSIRTIIWRKKDHFNHIHIDPWPKGYGVPPCKSGSGARYQWPNGDVKTTTKYGSFDPIGGYDELPDREIEEVDHMNQVIQKGASGFEVALVQQALIDLGYDLGNWAPFDGPTPEWWDGEFSPGADGVAGNAFVAAVTKFQEDNSLTANGVGDGVTIAFIFRAADPESAPQLLPHTHKIPADETGGIA